MRARLSGGRDFEPQKRVRMLVAQLGEIGGGQGDSERPARSGVAHPQLGLARRP
jgi:hypothetical protein